ncbi:MAG TPA: hypothetical protein VN040_01115 [Pseudosphingobacterium sp.]|nr:hypothetical protein [Pseudosphingobacterium sp.]
MAVQQVDWLEVPAQDCEQGRPFYKVFEFKIVDLQIDDANPCYQNKNSD